ncbi:PXMP2/4 family protein 3 [Tolypocladium ophioglossoides CBS 100239]|uniref:PXMP2/4 family protein 3 n=1 Tax=Tolypocladium ophioglossoides (strain CBS 100239) TaxID=1163406 RepID=A0A0L0NEX9_TOLOC|nr:PXMP2/4 family protein 3 [Tolypocladium ophioglossoides CBS 100239]
MLEHGVSFIFKAYHPYHRLVKFATAPSTMADSIAVQTAQAAGMSALSNIIAQYFAAYQTQSAFALELGALTRYVLYGILNTPLNCVWQEYLERKFPGQDAGRPAKQNDQRGHAAKNVKNLVIKFGLDQTVGAAGNILFFTVVHGVLNGTPVSGIRQAIIQDSLSIYLSGLMIWPLVSLISFAMLPVERRVIFGCAAGVAWGVYLSLITMGGDAEKMGGY